MKTKNQGLKIAQVTERLSTYRLHFSDNTSLDLPKIELGSFVPKKGMSVRFHFYRNLVLQKVDFNGQTVINYNLFEIMTKLCLIDDKLEDDVRRKTGDSEDVIYDLLQDVFKRRVDMLRYVTKLPIFQDYVLEEPAIEYEVAVCYLAQKLAQLGKDHLNKFRKLPLASRQALFFMKDIDLPMMDDIIERTEAYIDNYIDDNHCLETSRLMNLPYCVQINQEEHQELIKAYVSSLNNH